MAIANITGNILTDSGIATSSLLPLSGGTLTGALNGTSATFSALVKTKGLASYDGIIEADNSSTTGGGIFRIRQNGVISGFISVRGSALGTTDRNMTYAAESGLGHYFYVNDGSLSLTLSSTGAATFSNQVTMNGPAADWAAIIQNTNSTSGYSYGLKVKAGTSAGTDATFVLQDYAGNEFLTARGNGRIGIGISSPKTLLQINGGSGAYPTLGTNVTNSIFVGRNDGLLGMYLGYAADGNGWIQQMRNDSATAGNLILQPSGGAVNIGTTTNAYGLLAIKSNNTLTYGGINVYANGNDRFIALQHTGSVGVIETENAGSGVMTDMTFRTGGSERMRITSAGVINTTSRLNVNGAGDNSLFSLINNGTTYTLGFSPNATASTSTTLTITTATTTWVYNGTGTATWTLPNPSGTNQMFWIKNAGTGVLTLNAFSGTNIINNSATAVSSITIAVGATALIQQDGNVKSYQLQ